MTGLDLMTARRNSTGRPCRAGRLDRLTGVRVSSVRGKGNAVELLGGSSHNLRYIVDGDSLAGLAGAQIIKTCAEPICYPRAHSIFILILAMSEFRHRLDPTNRQFPQQCCW